MLKRVGVEKDKIRVEKRVMDVIATRRRTGVPRLGIPCGAVGVEIPQDNTITPGGEE